MKTKILIAITLLLLTGSALNAQYSIPADLFGINGWMNEKLGDTQNPYNCFGLTQNPVLTCNPNGYMDRATGGFITTSCSTKVKNLYAHLIRYGGTSNDFNFPTYQQFIDEIDRIRAMGSEPIIQIPYGDGHYTATDAYKLLDYLNNSRGKKIKYVEIANEPDQYADYPTTNATDKATFIADYFKNIAETLKVADASIKIIGPSLATYDYAVYQKLLSDPSTYTYSIAGKDGNNRYYLDIVDFHYYPFNGNQTLGNLQDNPAVSSGGLAFKLVDATQGMLNFISTANGYSVRSGNALQFSISEMNIDYQNPTSNTYTDRGANGFLAGQWMAECYAVAMDKANSSGVDIAFICPWSFHESNGDRSNYDLGIIDGTSPCSTTDIYRSTYAHLALMGQFFKGVFKMGTNNINNTPADLKVFSSYLANGYYAVMILNESSNSYADYTINTSSTLPTSGTLRIALNLSTNQSYTNSTYTLGAWTTHLAILDPCNNGTIIEIFEYDRDNLAKYDKLPIRKINTALPLTLQWSSMTNSNCSSNTGSATISASGGSGTYTYSWSSGITSTTASASNLAPGTYTVYVSNSSGCTAQEQATITIGNITPSASVLPTTSCNSSETFTASSGSSYSWSTGATTSGITVSQPSGPNSYTSYTVTVTDGTSGCANSAVATHFSPLSVTIEDGTTSTGTCCAVSLYATFIPGATYSWYIGGSLYTTTSTNKFDDPFSGPGDYTVKATLAGCNSPTSSIHKVTNNGHSCSCGRENAFSNPVDASSLVALNPNPSTGITSIYYTLVSQVTEARLEIVDIYGQKIKELILDVSDNQVLSDLSNLADGIYFVTLQINNSQNISTKKLVLQH